MAKQGTSLLQAGVNYVKSFVSGSQSGEEEAEDDEAKRKPDRRETEEESKELQDARRHVKQLQSAAKYAPNAADGGAKAVKALKAAEGRVEELLVASTPQKGSEEESKELQNDRRHVKQLQSAVKYASNAPGGGARAVKALKEAEGRVEELLVASTPQKGRQVEHGVTLEEVSPPSCSASQAGLIIKVAPKTSVTHQLFSSVPCNSLARLNKEVTFAVAASLPVVKLSNLERREERRPKADFDRLMLKVKKLKGFGLGVMGGHGVNSQWVNLTGK